MHVLQLEIFSEKTERTWSLFNMSKTVYAIQNDNLDAIVYRYFGKTLGIVETVLALNPKLAYTPVLEIGTAVILPENNEIVITTNKTTINLWD